MKSLKTDLILLFLFACTFFSACGDAGNSNTANSAVIANSAAANANSARTNVEELVVLINVPYEAQDVVWKEDAPHKKLIAVLRFSPADSSKLVAEAEKIKPPEKVTISTENWFPEELTAQSEMSSEDNLNGLAYAADTFLQPPYTDGRITRIEGTDYFVLEVSAK